jgi:O-succinylbenzoic acid--CoA ligase
VPTQLRRLLRTADRAPGSLKGVLLGGAALPPDLVDAALDAGWPLHTTYGCTEMASQIATTPPDAARDQLLHTAGRVLPHARLRVDDRGALLVRGASLFDGYVEGRSLHPARTSDGWYRTGDLGFLDGDGFLHVEGRTDRMFISGGENIQPEEIETALQRLDGVEQAAVVPVPNDAFGARPVAFVRMRGNTLSEEELLRRLEGVLPRYKLPVAFFPLPDAALHGQMKLDRQQLEQQARRLLYEQPPDAPDAS